jgi:hypothetical protein
MCTAKLPKRQYEDNKSETKEKQKKPSQTVRKMGRKYFFQSVRIITCRNDPKNIRNTPSSPYPPSFSSSSPRDPLHAPTSTPPPPSTEARRRILRSYVVGPSSSPAPLEWRAVKIHLEPAQGSDSLVGDEP